MLQKRIANETYNVNSRVTIVTYIHRPKMIVACTSHLENAKSLTFPCRISSNTLIREYNGLFWWLCNEARRTPLAKLDGTDRISSRLGSATPTGRPPAALTPPTRIRGELYDPTRRAAQQPPRDGGKLLAVTWRLDDWRLAPCRRVRRSPRPPPSLPPLSLSVCRLPPPPPPPLLPSQSPLSLLPRLSSRSFIYLFFHVRTRTRVLTRYVPWRTHVSPL